MGDAGAGDAGVGVGEALGVADDNGDAAAAAAAAAASAAVGEGTGGSEPVQLPPAKGEPPIESPSNDATTVRKVERKTRRRSMLTEEEGGLLSEAPTFRRSLLGY